MGIKRLNDLEMGQVALALWEVLADQFYAEEIMLCKNEGVEINMEDIAEGAINNLKESGIITILIREKKIEESILFAFAKQLAQDVSDKIMEEGGCE